MNRFHRPQPNHSDPAHASASPGPCVIGGEAAEEFHRDGLRMEARLLLSERKRLLIPTPAEWVGVNLLDLDGLLRASVKK